MPPTPDWNDRHALVTGGARGIGRAVTQALPGAGASALKTDLA
jgi:NAD(P)-dependent dehydrogenase (short-subunit alcohol dehydrogenase family)